MKSRQLGANTQVVRPGKDLETLVRGCGYLGFKNPRLRSGALSGHKIKGEVSIPGEREGVFCSG